MTYLEDPMVNQALDALSPSVEPNVDRALRQQLTLQARHGQAEFGVWSRMMSKARHLPNAKFQLPIAAALVLALMVFATPARGLAAQFMTIFRVQSVTPVNVGELTKPLPDLSKLGDMSANAAHPNLQFKQVSTLQEASAAVGFGVQAPSQLPKGLSATPSVMAVTSAQTVGFTFRADKAKSYLDSIGRKDIVLPPKFDGASLELHVQPAATIAYLPAGTNLTTLKQAASSEKAGGTPNARELNALMNGGGVFIAETKSPSLDASGVSLDDLRAFLLTLPIPDSTKAQLRQIGDWSSTLPVPVAPGSSMHKVQINGASGVAGRNGDMEMVLWVRNGMVYMASSPKMDEPSLLALAGSMH